MQSIHDTLKQGQVHDFIASIPDTAYGSHSLDSQQMIPRNTRVANLYIQNLRVVSLGADDHHTISRSHPKKEAKQPELLRYAHVSSPTNNNSTVI